MKFLITFITIDITVDDAHLPSLLKTASIQYDVVYATEASYKYCESISDIEATYERERNHVDSGDKIIHPTRKIKVLKVEYLPAEAG